MKVCISHRVVISIGHFSMKFYRWKMVRNTKESNLGFYHWQQVRSILVFWDF